MEMKMMIVDSIRYTLSVNNRLPRISFTGDWLNDLGFSHETIVIATHKTGVITLKAHGKGIDVYKSLVQEVRLNKQHLFQSLIAALGNGFYLDLTLEGAWLKRQGFNVGDIVLVRIAPKCIEIKKLNPKSLGFDEKCNFRLLQVQRYSDCGKVCPKMVFRGQWIDELGFTSDKTVNVTYKGNSIHFTVSNEERTTKKPRNVPLKRLNIGRISYKQSFVPFFALKGDWLMEMGFNIGDNLLIGMKQNYLHVKLLDIVSLWDR